MTPVLQIKRGYTSTHERDGAHGHAIVVRNKKGEEQWRIVFHNEWALSRFSIFVLGTLARARTAMGGTVADCVQCGTTPIKHAVEDRVMVACNCIEERTTVMTTAEWEKRNAVKANKCSADLA